MKLSGSTQHASGLDFAGTVVDSHLVVIQDQDCLVLKYKWIKTLENALITENYDLIGTPEAKSELNTHGTETLMEYKFISPLPFLIFGKSEIIFAKTFMPDSEFQNILDTGYRLSLDCLDGQYSYYTLNARSSRSSESDISFINNYSCTFYGR